MKKVMITTVLTCLTALSCFAMTEAQKKAMFWVDWGAGLAAAELGPLSFAVGAAASMAYYHTEIEKMPIYNPNAPTTGSGDNLLGANHNSLCIAYINASISTVNFADISRLAQVVRPDLGLLSEESYNAVMRSFDYKKFESPEGPLQFISENFELSLSDKALLRPLLLALYNAEEDEDFSTALAALQTEITKLSLDNNSKLKLAQSFSILEYSKQLWSNS